MLAALILVAAVANLNLAVANVALPDIGKAFDAGQTALNLVAIGYSLGLAASVLYLGAVGDRYGRKLLLIDRHDGLAIPASSAGRFAPSIEVLFCARVLGGLAAGLAFPTTLALITALWSGQARTRSIALWSGLGAAISSLGPLAGRRDADPVRLGVGVRDHPAAGGGGAVGWRSATCRPVNETTDPVDNLGGILSVVMIASTGAGDQLRGGPRAGGRCGRPRADRARRRRGRS